MRNHFRIVAHTTSSYVLSFFAMLLILASGLSCIRLAFVDCVRAGFCGNFAMLSSRCKSEPRCNRIKNYCFVRIVCHV